MNLDSSELGFLFSLRSLFLGLACHVFSYARSIDYEFILV